MSQGWDDIAVIAARASTLAERLQSGAGANPALADARLARWREVAVRGDQELFLRRLAWDSLDLDQARRALGGVPVCSGQPLPAWTGTLHAIMAAAAAPGDAAARRAFDPAAPLPFEELFVPFLHVARQRVGAGAGAACELLDERAHAMLERGLLLRLAERFTKTLDLEFSVIRTLAQSPLDRALGMGAPAPPRRLYREFIAGLLGDGLRTFFREYSVLARLAAHTVDDWVDATVELLRRLEQDQGAIRRRFGAGADPGAVVAAEPDLSDPHNGGRSVVALGYASGLRLVYKPKDLGIERAYGELLAWLNQQGAPLPFKILNVLDRPGYGWVEYVEPQPCRTPDQARCYFERAGMLICLVYVLGGTDCHYENLVAAGEHPVLIDLETLMHPWLRGEEHDADTDAAALSMQQLWDSVLRSGLLPRWEFGPDRRSATDVSGLGGFTDQETAVQVQRWRQINSDLMELATIDAPGQPRPGGPILDGTPLAPGAFADALADGFRRMYSFLAERAGPLLADDSPLVQLGRQRVRLVYRPTRAYAAVRSRLLNPKCLRDGADFAIEADFLCRALTSSGERSRFWPLLAVELRALERGDIPFFAARADSDGLEIAPGQELPGCFLHAGVDQVRQRLRQLGAAHMEQQIALIRGTLYARTAASGPSTAEPAPLDGALPPPAAEALIEEALVIAEDIRRRAILGPDGSASWIGLEYLGEAGRFQLQPMGPALYDGASGVALFLAALEHVTGGAGYRDLALAGLQPLRLLLRALAAPAQQALAQQIGIGGASGVGGFVYALARAGRLLGSQELLQDATRAAALIAPATIRADRSLDVVAGAAGAILGLLALHESTGDAGLLEQAHLCALHLLEQRTPSAAGPRAWPTRDGQLLAGFGHGAAGIAYALLRLHAVAPDGQLVAAAQEALAYERSVFSAAAGNWPDLRASEGDAAHFMCGWCSGAPGVGLARLGGLPALDTPEVRQELAVALETTLATSRQAVDHLCCGHAGRIELALTAGLRLGRSALIERARQVAAGVLVRARRNGQFSLVAGLPREVATPGLFQGTAGMGYTLLRLARPELVPSLLLWE